MHDRFMKDGQYGLPVRSAIMATAGYSPSDLENLQYLENTILELNKKEVPLTSSNTQSAPESDPGRPTNQSKGEVLTDSGENSKEQDLSSGG